MPRRAIAALAVGVALAGALAGCAGPNLWTDGTSVSTGTSNRGRLRHPAKLPTEGPGYVIPTRWSERAFNFGVDELVVAIKAAAKVVRGKSKTVTLGVADLSPLAGGRSRWHSSHQSGRDVDLLFYSVDAEGKVMAPPMDDMIHYDGEGKAYAPRRVVYAEEGWELRRFDTARNWQLLEALLSDPTIRLHWVFVSNPLRERLLAHARQRGRPAAVVEYAAAVMRQPGDAPPHDDHFHVRIFCSRADRFHGCVDRGPIWQHEKKAYKYGGPERYDPVAQRLLAAAPILVGTP
ncbi:MAG TPA: penicillin-insensitive murein endopeptidase [Nannocystaceae bacterium]|nr:penicillin-insensitive murein endopeptidase [Nannocystaceae bacterium]